MNIKEFSKKIGVPVSTISKALGDYKDVNAKTKKRIIELAKKHNYAPNIYAKTLASGITFSVGLVLPLSYSYEQKITLIDFIENIHSNLNSLHIPVIMLFAKNKKEEIEAFEKLIKHHKVRLVLLNDTINTFLLLNCLLPCLYLFDFLLIIFLLHNLIMFYLHYYFHDDILLNMLDINY